eukprot:2411144-Rhodomonas_salina.1
MSKRCFLQKVHPGGSHRVCELRRLRSRRQDSGFRELRQHGEAVGRGIRIPNVFPGGSHWLCALSRVRS